MSTTTDVPGFGRSRRGSRPDPATVWAPLGRLAEAATTVEGAGAIAVNRGFDRNSRQRAKALRELLEERDVQSIEVTPASASERLLADAEVAGVVNLVGTGTWQPYRLAAKLRAPLLTPLLTDDKPATVVHRNVIGVTDEAGHRDVALTRVAALPEDAAEATLLIRHEDEPLSIPGGQIAVTPGENGLVVHLQGPDYAEQTLSAQEITVTAHGSPYRLTRDELPIAEFEGELTFTSEQQGLTVHTV